MRCTGWLASLALVVMAFASAAESAYVIPPAGQYTSSSRGLVRVDVAGVSNSTSYKELPNGYKNYGTGVFPAIEAGSTVQIAMRSAYNFNSSTDDLYAFVDWSRDEKFDDDGEFIGWKQYNNGQDFVTSFVVPEDAEGIYRFRFRSYYNGPSIYSYSARSLWVQATEAGGTFYSDCEDYEIEVYQPLSVPAKSLTASPGLPMEGFPEATGGSAPYSYLLTPNTNADWLKFDVNTGRIFGVIPHDLAGETAIINVEVTDANNGTANGTLTVQIREALSLPYVEDFEGVVDLSPFEISLGDKAEVNITSDAAPMGVGNGLALSAQHDASWVLENHTNPANVTVLDKPEFWDGSGAVDPSEHYGNITYVVTAPNVRRLSMNFDYRIINESFLPGNEYFANFAIEYIENGENKIWAPVGGDTAPARTFFRNKSMNYQNVYFDFELSGSQETVAIRLHWLTRNSVNSSTATAIAIDNLVTAVPAHMVASPSLPTAQETRPYGPYNIEIVGGVPPYTVTPSVLYPLPVSLNLAITQDPNTNGWSISAKDGKGPFPGTNGVHTFGLTITDSNSRSSTRNFSLSVSPAPVPLNVDTDDMPSTARGGMNDYVQQIEVSGGVDPYTYALNGAPGFLSIDAMTGELRGTIGAAEPFAEHNFTVEVTDLIGTVAFKTYTLAIVEDIAFEGATLNDAEVGKTFAQLLGASGGTLPYVFTILSGNKPAGLTLDSVFGELNGVPFLGSEGDYNFRVRVEDSGTQVAEADFVIKVDPQSTTSFGFVTKPTDVGIVRIGETKSLLMEAQGGIAPYTFENVNNGLPAGMSLASDGRLVGSPGVGTEGSYLVRVRVSDSQNSSAILNLSIVIEHEYVAPNILTTTIGTPRVGESVLILLEVENGIPPYTWSLAAGSLPTGLSLNSAAGSLTGTLLPLALGDNPINFTLRVTDGTQTNSDDQLIGGTIQPGTFSALNILNDQEFPQAVAGSGHFSAPVKFSGGVPPLTWSLSGGQLPPGLQITPNGAIQGNIPTGISGVYSFSVQVKDRFDSVAERPMTLAVVATAQQVVEGPPADGLAALPGSGAGGGCALSNGTKGMLFFLLIAFGGMVLMRRRKEA